MMILILTMILLIQCRSRVKKVFKSEEVKTSEVFKKQDSVETEKSSQLATKIDKTIVNNQEKVNDGFIIIKGKVDSISKDFNFHNIVNGDTLSSVSIHGNADFQIRNNWKIKEIKKDSIVEFYDLNIIQKVARKSVAKETISKVAEKIISKENTIKAKGFGIAVYIIFGIILLVAVILFIIIKNIKK